MTNAERQEKIIAEMENIMHELKGSHGLASHTGKLVRNCLIRVDALRATPVMGEGGMGMTCLLYTSPSPRD